MDMNKLNLLMDINKLKLLMNINQLNLSMDINQSNLLMEWMWNDFQSVISEPFTTSMVYPLYVGR